MFRFLNEMALVQVPRLKDFNRCLAVATQSVIARPEANEILAKLLEKYQPNAETMVYVIRHQFKAKHRLLKRAFEKEEKTLVPLLNFIDTFTLLHKAPVQMALLENVLKCISN
jgi:hypothetical protein